MTLIITVFIFLVLEWNLVTWLGCGKVLAWLLGALQEDVSEALWCSHHHRVHLTSAPVELGDVARLLEGASVASQSAAGGRE